MYCLRSPTTRSTPTSIADVEPGGPGRRLPRVLRDGCHTRSGRSRLDLATQSVERRRVTGRPHLDAPVAEVADIAVETEPSSAVQDIAAEPHTLHAPAHPPAYGPTSRRDHEEAWSGREDL